MACDHSSFMRKELGKKLHAEGYRGMSLTHAIEAGVRHYQTHTGKNREFSKCLNVSRQYLKGLKKVS